MVEQMEQNQTVPRVNTKPKRRSALRQYLPVLLVLLVIVLALTSFYFYKKSTTNPNAASEAEVKSLVQKVGRLFVVPTDETPTVATVSDPAALKNQAFFVDAKKGDKVLIYSNAKKAILYDPVADKIVNIAPLNTEGTAPAPTNDTSKTTNTTKKN